MERWDYKSLKQQHGQYRTSAAVAATTTREKEQQYPSFSSTLLDSIYRSIDEASGEFCATATTTMKGNNQVWSKEEDLANYKRAFLIDKWTEKKKLATSGSEKHATSTTIVRQKSMADFHRGPTKSTSSGKMKNQNLSSSSNSDSSFSGRLSSSEAESNNNNISSSGGSTLLSDFKFPQKPKPIRTTSNHHSEMSRKKHEASSSDCQVENLQRQKSKHETNNNNTSSTSTSTSTSSNNNVAATKTKKLTRALKIYSDLKKTKQPISPGGRLAGFINSLFTNGNTKQQNSGNSRSTTQFDAKSPYSSNCSSASSFSRSCLSKGSLNSNGAAGEKRSVRFYPVSVIVDEDCRPCGQKSLHEDPHHLQIVEQQKLRHVDLDMKFVTEAFDGDDDDDDVSCTSSDLFELDNLGSIGIDCYREELPVYETTRFDLNRVISKGLIV